MRAALSPDKPPANRDRLIELSVLLLFILLAGLSASPWPDGQDGVNFILGINRYDPLVHQPHFPGYPVYMALCKVSTFFSGTPERGAINLSIFSGALSIYLIIRILKNSFPPLTAILCGILLALNPVFFEFSHKIFSEIFALALLLLSIALLKTPETSSGRRWFSSLLIMGLLLGVRLSWWPFPLIYALAGIYYKRVTQAAAGLFFGILIWLVPQTSRIGLQDFLQSGISFTHGHFTKWGGGVGSLFEQENRVVLFSKRASEAWGLLPDTALWLSAPWCILTLLGLLYLINFNRVKGSGGKENPLHLIPRQFTLFFTALSGYLLWVFWGQNPEKVRHLIPLIPGFIVVSAPAVRKIPTLALIASLSLLTSLSLNYAFRGENLPPNKKFMEWAGKSTLTNTDFFCGPSERYFDIYPIRSRVVSVTSMEELPLVVKATWPESGRRLLCDDIPGFKADRDAHHYFSARRGDPVDRPLKIYELR